MNYHWILTLQSPQAGGIAMGSYEGKYVTGPGVTRQRAYEEILQDVKNRAGISGHVNVLFFSLEPDELGG